MFYSFRTTLKGYAKQYHTKQHIDCLTDKEDSELIHLPDDLLGKQNREEHRQGSHQAQDRYPFGAAQAVNGHIVTHRSAGVGKRGKDKSAVENEQVLVFANVTEQLPNGWIFFVIHKVPFPCLEAYRQHGGQSHDRHDDDGGRPYRILSCTVVKSP